MLRFLSLTLLCFTAVSFAQPRITGAKLETRSAAAGLEREFQSILNGAGGPVWVGYSVAAIDREHQGCRNAGCRCQLEGDGHQVSTGAAPAKLEGPARIAILIRIEKQQVGRVRVYSEDCELDAGGLPVYWLKDVRPAESVDLLARQVRAGGDSLRDSTILAVALHDDQAADRMMDQFAAHAEPEAVREKAIFWLGAVRGKRGYETLRRVVRDDASDHIREKAVFALSINKTPEALDAMIDTAHHDVSGHVRGQALFWLAQKAGHKAEAAITDAVADDPDTAVKKQAVFALSQLPKQEGVPLLIETARTNRNPAVRKQAMFWLGQSEDPRALSFFEDVLKK